MNSQAQTNPENFLSMAYLLANYQTPNISSKGILNSKKSQISLVVDNLSSGIEENELLYPKSYVENIRSVI